MAYLLHFKLQYSVLDDTCHIFIRNVVANSVTKCRIELGMPVSHDQPPMAVSSVEHFVQPKCVKPYASINIMSLGRVYGQAFHVKLPIINTNLHCSTYMPHLSLTSRPIHRPHQKSNN